MSVHMLIVYAVVLASGLQIHSQDQQAAHKQAIAEIRRMGGEVIVKADKRDHPVTVILTGATNPSHCVRYLRYVSNIQTCDL